MNQDNSYLKLKRQTFHQEIRKRKLQGFFNQQRKQLLLKQLNPKNANSQFANMRSYSKQKITSIDDLIQHLDPLLQFHDFEAINEYITCVCDQNQEQNYEVQQQILNKMISLFLTRKQYFKNQTALGCFGNFLNCSNTNYNNSLYQVVEYFVESLIQQNLVEIHPLGHQNTIRHGIDYLQTICWFLSILAFYIRDPIKFQSLQKYYPIMQYQMHGKGINFPFLTLVSYLSTNSKLLPSQHYISSLLSHQLNITCLNNDQRILYCIVTLLDNFLRFQTQENLYLAEDYVKFINYRVKEVNFPKKLKIQLISLFESLINSSSNHLLIRLFQNCQTKQLLQQIYYRCRYANKQAIIQSMHCFLAILFKVNLQIIEQIIQPQKIVCLFVSSLTTPIFIELRKYIFTGIGFLLEKNRQFYKNLFMKENIKNQIQILSYECKNNDQTQRFLVYLMEEYFMA